MAEKISLSDTLEEAIEKFKQFGKVDPYPEIEPSLLNSADILDYVAKTGMIYPFDVSCLKPASYGVKLQGEYMYWESLEKPAIEGKLENITEKDIDGDFVFILKKDSIAFVGLEPDFRFPDYIAARFNLKIKHIYQGLLLGTGPIVDPGYQGKIYIPLHNLTNNDYKIKINKTLIWMEFTKLSSNKNWRSSYNKNEDRIGEYIPFDFDKLRVKKNLKGYLADSHNGAILSTMQGLQSQINKNLDDTKDLQKQSQSTLDRFNWLGILSIATLLIGITTFMYNSFIMNNQNVNDYQKMEKHIDSLNKKLDSIIIKVQKK